MRLKHKFSIIELLTVVLVILLLISLTLPIFVNLKKNARNVICKSNLRQMGILLTSYQSDQEGHLPYGSIYDIPNAPTGKNNRLYANWNGHLIPYLDIKLTDNYNRVAMVTSQQCTRSSASQLGGPPNPPPSDVLKNGWVVIDDAYRNGGYQDLKVFICPEMHQNSFDISTALKFNGIKIPRVSQLITGGHTPWSAFADKASWDYGMGGGLPCSYQANNTFFNDTVTLKNSYRMDEIPSFSEKVLILEGKGAVSGGLYYSKADISSETSFTYGGFAGTDPGLSFVHDNHEQFWVANLIRGGAWWRKDDFYLDCAEKFNTQYKGKAYMVLGYNGYGSYYFSAIVSFIYPGDDGKYFHKFLKDFDAGMTISAFKGYIDDPNEMGYLTGSMNVLFGDNSVETKGQEWLFNNNQKIAQINQSQ